LFSEFIFHSENRRRLWRPDLNIREKPILSPNPIWRIEMADLAAVLSQLQVASRVPQNASLQDPSLLHSAPRMAPALLPAFSAPTFSNPHPPAGRSSLAAPPDPQLQGELLRPIVDRPLAVVAGERVTTSQGGGARKIQAQSSAPLSSLSVKPPPKPSELQIVFTGRPPDLSKAAETVPDFPRRVPLTARRSIRFSGAGRLQEFLDACDPFALVELPPGELTEDVVINKSLHLVGRGTLLRGVGKSSTITIDCNEAVLENLTIEQANTKAAGAVAVGTGYTKIVNCRISAPFMSAVVAYGRSKVDIESCEVFGSYNPCLYASERAEVRCESSLIHHYRYSLCVNRLDNYWLPQSPFSVSLSR
jgi:hypothetical protein